MQCSLAQLFFAISEESAEIPQPRFTSDPGELFGDTEKHASVLTYEDADIALIAALHSEGGIDFSSWLPCVNRLYEISADAFYAIARAWMSELPVIAQVVRFGRRLFACAGRQEAARMAGDRGCQDAQSVQEAAYKTWHEYHRLTGLLRFSPDAEGAYIARCAPDHFVLPALGPHFAARFGQTPWAIIDEKRRLCLCRLPCRLPEFYSMNENQLIAANPAGFAARPAGGEWEELWRQYYKTINNESRDNPNLQRQFMPERYWKYLPEKDER